MKKLILLATWMTTWISGMSQQALTGTDYWVVETHSRDSVYSIVRFYDGNSILLHEVKIDNVVINIQQKKYRKRLDQLLWAYQVRTASSAKKIRSRLSA
jgi:hypothetical protein